MNKPKIYIAGKVSGLDPDEVAQKFATYSRLFRMKGFLPINPVEAVNDPLKLWNDAMKLCVPELLKADAIYLQPDFEDSNGSKLELFLANRLDIPSFSDFDTLRAHFGRLPVDRCNHPEGKRRLKVLGGNVGCEITVTVCAQCGRHMTEPAIEC